MAGNLKGLGGLKGLLLRHGEKAAIAVVAFVALWVVYKTTSLPRLDDKLKADQLHQAISQAKSAVEKQEWPDATSDQASEVQHYKPIGEKADSAIDAKQYIWESLPDPAVVASTVLRSDPKLLNAADVRGSGGSGLLAFLDEAIRKQQERARIAEEAEKAKKELDRQEKEQKKNAEGGPGAAAGPGGNRRGRGGPEDVMNQPYDPAHPKRRGVQGMAKSLGVPLQGGERIEKAYWAIVVAKVPIREQLKLYQDAFEKAKGGFDPQRDFPQYKGYFVQRAEVVPGKDAKDLDWQPVKVFDGQHASLAKKPISVGGVGEKTMTDLFTQATQFWAGMSPDVVDARFSDPILTFPLPPLVGRDWGNEAKHPDFPTIADTPPLEQEVPAIPGTVPNQPAPGTPKEPADENSAFGAANPGAVGPGGFAQPGMGPGGPGMFRGGPEGGMMRGGRYGGEGRMVGPGPGGPGMFRGGPEGGMMRGGPGGMEGGGRSFAGPMPGGGMGQARTSLPKGVDFLMLRFVDFTVEPGKKYRYRVSLVLSDANYSIPENVLASDVSDRHRKEAQAAKATGGSRRDMRRVEGWSDPSPIVGIPLSGGAKLVDVKTPSADKVNDEPTASLLVDSFDTDEKGNALQAAKKHDFKRGNVANMTEEVEYLGEGGLWIDTAPSFHFVTGLTVLDMDGGKKLPSKDLTSPGRVLLMGPAGDLYIRNELDDKEAVEYHRMLFEVDKKRAGFEGGPGGEFGPGGPGAGRRPPTGRGPGR